MRLLVQCAGCHRQFDATGREVGSKFRCHCGQVVVVPAPQHHDAAVTRCSSCGAARDEGDATCAFCGASFTLLERDLHTICPNCFARVSDRGSFCHHCGTRLEPEQSADAIAESCCPACPSSPHLTHRRIGDVNLLECGTCAGLWVGLAAFESLLARARETTKTEMLLPLEARPRPATVQGQRGRMYRKCIECGELMSRRNYGRVSGVIIDICPNHGIWFDADELDAVLRWVQQGGEGATRDAEERERDYQRRLARRVEMPERPTVGSVAGAGIVMPPSSSSSSVGTGLVETLVDLIASLFP